MLCRSIASKSLQSTSVTVLCRYRINCTILRSVSPCKFLRFQHQSSKGRRKAMGFSLKSTSRLGHLLHCQNHVRLTEPKQVLSFGAPTVQNPDRSRSRLAKSTARLSTGAENSFEGFGVKETDHPNSATI